jgi:hypothetical protein
LIDWLIVVNWLLIDCNDDSWLLLIEIASMIVRGNYHSMARAAGYKVIYLLINSWWFHDQATRRRQAWSMNHHELINSQKSFKEFHRPPPPTTIHFLKEIFPSSSIYLFPFRRRKDGFLPQVELTEKWFSLTTCDMILKRSYRSSDIIRYNSTYPILVPLLLITNCTYYSVLLYLHSTTTTITITITITTTTWIVSC